MNIKFIHFKYSIWLFLLINQCYNIRAQVISLDSTFGNFGMTTTDVMGNNDIAQSVVQESDGKLVVTGYSSLRKIILRRYNIDGSLDTLFGTDGIVNTQIDSLNKYGDHTLVIQKDSKIIVVGSGIDIIRYNSNGSLDTTFGSEGIVIKTFNNFSPSVKRVALQDDGKIVIAGHSFDGDFSMFVARFNSDGSIDSTFNRTGVINTDFGNSFDDSEVGYDLIILKNGKILVGGQNRFGSNYNFAIIRLTTKGDMDSTFGNNGITSIDLLSNSKDIGYSIAIQQDDKIVIGGDYIPNTPPAAGERFALLRLNADGHLDSTFGNKGIVYSPKVGSDNGLRSIVIQESGKIIALGSSRNGSNFDITLFRYDNNGKIDSSFGTNGIYLTNFGNADEGVNSAIIQSDNKLVIAGSIQYSGTLNRDFLLVRYNVDLKLSSLNFKPLGQIHLFPNPTSNFIKLVSKYYLKNATLNIYDSYGDLEKNINNISGFDNSIELIDLVPGLYFMELIQNNLKFDIIKFVKVK